SVRIDADKRRLAVRARRRRHRIRRPPRRRDGSDRVDRKAAGDQRRGATTAPELRRTAGRARRISTRLPVGGTVEIFARRGVTVTSGGMTPPRFLQFVADCGVAMLLAGASIPSPYS